jgi:hypothetical protein
MASRAWASHRLDTGLVVACFTCIVARGARAAEDTTPPPPSITSDSACPSAQAIEAALASLRAPGDWPVGRVRVQAEGDALWVDLGPDQPKRRVPVTADCDERATTVALVIATWSDDLPTDAASTPLLRTRAVPGVRRLEAQSSPPSTPGASSSEHELGAGIFVAVSDGIAPGVSIDFVQTRASNGLGWQADLALPGYREQVAPGGSTRWTRATLTLSINGRATIGRFILSGDAGLAGAYTLTSGRGYSIEASGLSALTAGGVAGVRAALPLRGVRLWVGLRVFHWLLPHTVLVSSTDGARVGTAVLPSTDVHCGAGLSYLFR